MLSMPLSCNSNRPTDPGDNPPTFSPPNGPGGTPPTGPGGNSPSTTPPQDPIVNPPDPSDTPANFLDFLLILGILAFLFILAAAFSKSEPSDNDQEQP